MAAPRRAPAALPGKEHTVIGEMESGKGWLAVGCATSELTKGNRVVYIHFEEADPADTIERLQALRVPDQVILERFTFVGPNEPVDQAALAVLLDPAPSLVVLDGVNEALYRHRWSVNDTDGAAAYRRHLVRPCNAVGAAVLSADHVVKDQDKRGRNALGSIHKGNGITGSLISLENVAPFGPGARGASHVFVNKDRPGHLRRHGKPTKLPGKTYVGTLIVDATYAEIDQLDLVFTEPSDDTKAAPAITQDGSDDQKVLEVVGKLTADGHEPAQAEGGGQDLRHEHRPDTQRPNQARARWEAHRTRRTAQRTAIRPSDCAWERSCLTTVRLRRATAPLERGAQAQSGAVRRGQTREEREDDVTAPAWPPRPADRIVHRWSCTHPPAEDFYRLDPKTGQAVIVKRSPSCGAVERQAPP